MKPKVIISVFTDELENVHITSTSNNSVTVIGMLEVAKQIVIRKLKDVKTA